MNSIEIKDFEVTLQKFIKEYDLPSEVKRLVIKEIYDQLVIESNNEMIQQAKERESKSE